jgi:hypothetical protein
MTIVTCPNPTPRAIRSTSLTTLAIISLSMIGILAHMFSPVNARKLPINPPHTWRIQRTDILTPRAALPRGFDLIRYTPLAVRQADMNRRQVRRFTLKTSR